MMVAAVVVLTLAALSLPGRADEEILGLSATHRRIRSADVGPKGRSIAGPKTLRIVTILSHPFTMLKQPPPPEGESPYEGFIPDLLDQLSQRAGFNYTLYESPDGKYGSMDASGVWNGMIAECLKNERNPSTGADMAAASLTITKERERAINFMRPYMESGLTVLIKKPIYNSHSVSLLAVFDLSVWGLLVLAIIGVGGLLWLMNRYNPYEWGGKVELTTEDQSKTFNLPGSLWFVFTSLFWQGFERSPRSKASRFLSTVWFLFVLILVLTYTASLINHVFWAGIVRTPPYPFRPAPFRNLEDLMLNSKFKVGAIANGSTFDYIYNYAHGQDIELVRRMWSNSFREPDRERLLMSSIEEGVDKVRTERYAFIVESSTANHLVQQIPCDLMIIGDEFRMRGYGLVLPNNSVHMDRLNVALLELIEMEVVAQLERKWWYQKGQCTTKGAKRPSLLGEVTSAKYGTGKARPANFDTLSGAFLLMLVGAITSVVIGGVELLYFRKRGQHPSGDKKQETPLKLNADENNL